MGATPRDQQADALAPPPTDLVHAEIAALEARPSQLRGPSILQLYLGEPQEVAKVAVSPLLYAWQK